MLATFYDAFESHLADVGQEAAVAAESLVSEIGFKHFAFPVAKYLCSHHWIRPHTALDGKTPAQAAGIELDLTGNKWESLIKKAATPRKLPAEETPPMKLPEPGNVPPLGGSVQRGEAELNLFPPTQTSKLE